MTDGYVKLFSSILDSTLWQQDPPTKVLWITLLAMANWYGEVHASIPGLAHRAGIALEECERALNLFQQPDKYSRTADHQGRRIQTIEGGWLVLNYTAYRARMSGEDRRERDRIRQERHRTLVTQGGVTKRDSDHQIKIKIKDKTTTSKPDGFDAALEEVFSYFLKATHKNPRLYLFSTHRKNKTSARLAFCQKLAKDGSLENAVGLLKVAIDRFAASSFHNGHNDRGKKYLELELLFRSDDYLSKWLDDSNFQLQGELA